MNTLDVGSSCFTRKFKLDNGQILQVTVHVASVASKMLTVNLS